MKRQLDTFKAMNEFLSGMTLLIDGDYLSGTKREC